MIFPDIKETKHEYRGYTIIGSTIRTQGGYVLGGRHFKEGGLKRNYNIMKDGRYIFSKNEIIERLKHAKEEIDDYIQRKSEKQ